jgi:hypothetical protein
VVVVLVVTEVAGTFVVLVVVVLVVTEVAGTFVVLVVVVLVVTEVVGTIVASVVVVFSCVTADISINVLVIVEIVLFDILKYK